MTNFLERFKGKTTLMGKDGLPGLLSDNDKPITKPNFISIINEKEPLPSFKTRSLNNINQLNHDHNLKNTFFFFWFESTENTSLTITPQHSFTA